MTEETAHPVGDTTQESWADVRGRTFETVPALEEMYQMAADKTVAELFAPTMQYVVDPAVFPKAPVLIGLIGKTIEDVYGDREIAEKYTEQLLKRSSVLNVQVHFSLLRSFDASKRLNDDGTVKPNEHYNSIILNSEVLWIALCRHFGLHPLSVTYGGINPCNETSPAFLQYGPKVDDSLNLFSRNHKKDTACLSFNPPKGFFYDTERDGIFPYDKYVQNLWEQHIFEESTSSQDQTKILETMKEIWGAVLKGKKGQEDPNRLNGALKGAMNTATFPGWVTGVHRAKMVRIMNGNFTDLVANIPKGCPEPKRRSIIQSLKTLEEQGFLKGISRLYADQLNALFGTYKGVRSVEMSGFQYEFMASLLEDKSTLTHYIHTNPDVYKLFLDSYKDIAMGWQAQEQSDGTIAYDTLYRHTPTREKYPEEGYKVSPYTGFVYDPKTGTSNMVYEASALAEGYRTHQFSPKTIQTVIFDMIEGGMVLIGGVAQINYNKCVVERTKVFFDALEQGIKDGKYPALPEGLTFENLHARIRSMQENQRPLTVAGIATLQGKNPWELGDYGQILAHPEFSVEPGDISTIMAWDAQKAMARSILALHEYKRGSDFEKRVGDHVITTTKHPLSTEAKRALVAGKNLPALAICPKAASVVGLQGRNLGNQGPNNPNMGPNQE